MFSKQKVLAWVVVILAIIAALIWWSRKSEGDVSGQVSAEMQNWKEFVSPNNQFSTLLPTLPQHASDAVPLPLGQGIIKYDMYMSQEKDGTTFMISTIQYPPDFKITSPQDLYDNVVKELVAGNAHNKLKYSEKAFYEEYPALDFLIENSAMAIKTKTFLVDRTLYILTLLDRTPLDVDQHFTRYASAFHLLKAPAVCPPEAPVQEETNKTESK